jgi:hypothetical protein
MISIDLCVQLIFSFLLLLLIRMDIMLNIEIEIGNYHSTAQHMIFKSFMIPLVAWLTSILKLKEKKL